MKAKLILTVIMPTLLLPAPSALAQSAGQKPSALTSFTNALNQDGFDVRIGTASVWNLVEQWCAGTHGVDSALFLNVEPYLQVLVPKSAQEPSGAPTSDFHLGADEAIVLIGLTPPPLRYFSYTPYLASRVYPDRRQEVLASLGDGVNSATVKTLGPTPFDGPVVLIFTPDQETDARIRAALHRAGYPAAIINTVVFPASMLNLGFGETADQLRIVFRTAMWVDPDSGDAYMNNPPLQIFRVSPRTQALPNPFPAPLLRVRGTGRSEMYLMNKLGELRQAIIDAYQARGLHATDIQSRPMGYEGYDYIQRGLAQPCVVSENGNVICGPPIADGVLGDSRDCLYLAAGWLPDGGCTERLTLADDEFLVLYGPNHIVTGKATYMNIGVYASETAKLTLGTLNDLAFPGSASVYLPGDPAADLLYAYKVSRSSGKDEPYCLPLKSPCPRLALDSSTLLGIFPRIYLEPATKVGPAMQEILYDRVIKFSPRQ